MTLWTRRASLDHSAKANVAPSRSHDRDEDPDQGEHRCASSQLFLRERQHDLFTLDEATL